MARKSIVTFRVGLLMAVAIVLLCFAIFSIGHGSRLFKRTDVIEAHFQRINGLQTGAPVTFAGVNIGAVDSIRFPRDPRADYVIVRMWIEARALGRIRADSVAHISTMGLLGDKYVEISAGNPHAAAIQPGSVIPSRNPIDYEALLQKKGTDDLIANTIAISSSLRALLDSLEKGHGIITQLIKGEPGVPPKEQFTLASIQKTMENMNRLTAEMEKTLVRINNGHGLVGAMLSDRVNGRQILANVTAAATSMKVTAQKMDVLIDRFNKAQGTVPRLLEDKHYADQVLANMQESSEDLKDILHKINTGQGTIGLAVNDPTLYRDATGAFSGGPGWGLRLINGLYSLTHPFYNPGTRTSPAQPLSAAVESGSSSATLHPASAP